MADMHQVRLVKFNPRPVAQLTPLSIHAPAGNTGGIEKYRAVAIALVGGSLSLTPLESVMHMAKDHQAGAPPRGQLIEGQRKISVAPVARGLFPIPPARIRCLRAKACWT